VFYVYVVSYTGVPTGMVTTWMGDYLQACKPSGYVTSHLGQLSLLPSVGW